MKWYAHWNMCRLAYEFLLVDESRGRRAYGEPLSLTLKTVEPADQGLIREPTLSLPHEAAESLFQALWDAGLRPNDGAGGGAEAKALRDHIAFSEIIAKGLLARLPSGKTADDREQQR